MTNLLSQHHSFDIYLAEKYGIEEAILIHHFQHWISLNNRKGTNLIQKKTWSYQTFEEIANHFPYLNRNKVKHTINCLVNKGILIKGNFNKKKMDKTTWFAFKEEEKFIKINKDSKKDYDGQNSPSMEKNSHPLDKNSQAIPDTKTDTKNIYTIKRKRATDTNFLQIKERVRLTQKQYDLLKNQYPSEALEWILNKLNTYKTTYNQEYTSDFKAINKWVISAWKNYDNLKHAKNDISIKNKLIIQEIQEALERQQKRGGLKIDGDEASDIVLCKSCKLNNPEMPRIVANWYGWKWTEDKCL